MERKGLHFLEYWYKEDALFCKYFSYDVADSIPSEWRIEPQSSKHRRTINLGVQSLRHRCAVILALCNYMISSSLKDTELLSCIIKIRAIITCEAAHAPLSGTRAILLHWGQCFLASNDSGTLSSPYSGILSFLWLAVGHSVALKNRSSPIRKLLRYSRLVSAGKLRPAWSERGRIKHTMKKKIKIGGPVCK